MSRLKQSAAAEENPLNSNYGVMMILNCSESLDSHLCGECVLRGPGHSKRDKTSLCNLKKAPMPFIHDQSPTRKQVEKQRS